MFTMARLFLGLRGLLKRIPWQVWVAIACIVAVLFYGHYREAQGYAKAEAYWKAEAEALEEARQAALDSEEAALRQLSKDTDNAVYEKREATRDRVERFIRSGGVRGQTCPSYRGSEDRSAGNSEAMRETSELDGTERLPEVVTVLSEDVRICTDNTIKAEEWRKLLLSIEDR